MTDEAVVISITIRVSEREVKIEKKLELMDMEETIQGIMLEAGQQILGMGIKVIDERMAEKVPRGWQNVGTEERRLISSMGALRYKRRVYLDENKQRRKPVDEILGIRALWAYERTCTRDGIISGLYGNVPLGSQSAQLVDQDGHQSQRLTTDGMDNR